MGRILVLAVLIGLVVLALRGYRRQREIQKVAPELPAQEACRCAHCGVYVPRCEGIASGVLFYCCEAHKNLGQR
jgi:uncharacterized protein